MLAVSGGALWLMSTLNGQSGFFYNEWHSTTGIWHRTQVPADQCPRIAPEFLAQQRIALGDQIYRQEYQCEFLSTGAQVFSQELLQQAFDDLYDPINGGRPLFSEPRPPTEPRPLTEPRLLTEPRPSESGPSGSVR